LDPTRKKRCTRRKNINGAGSANGACILHVAVAGFNEQEPLKERNINSSYGFAKSVGARQQKRPSRSIRFAAIAAPALARIHPGPRLILALVLPWPRRRPEVHRLVGLFLSALSIPILR